MTFLRHLLMIYIFGQTPCLQAGVLKKATRGPSGPLYSVELVVEVTSAARPKVEIEAAITLNKAVQTCLRDTLVNVGDDFSVVLAGQIKKSGELTDILVDSIYSPLNQCVGQALGQISLAAGRSGPFKMEISKLHTTGTGAKTFLLDLNSSKKLQ